MTMSPSCGGDGELDEDQPAVETSSLARASSVSPASAVPSLGAGQMAKIIASDGSANEMFGSTLWVDGETIAFGLSHDDPHGPYSGSAYVFTRNGTEWVLQAKVTPGDAAASAYFGNEVAVSGDTLLVGAPGDSEKGSETGAAYVFVRQNGVWMQQAKLIVNDPGAGDHFGQAVAISGDTALISARYDDDAGLNSGSAYIFTRNGTTWTQQAKLVGSNSGPGDEYGVSVAISGDTALVGSWYGGPNDQGAAYVFKRNGTVWTEQAKLLASDGQWHEAFGVDVALEGDLALVGAFYAKIGSNWWQGATYVYARNGNTWTEEAKLVASDGAYDDHFGYAVALSGDVAFIGAGTADPKGAESGAAYFYRRQNGSWTQEAKVIPNDGAAGDQFGFVVSISGHTAVSGSLYDDVWSNGNQGSAYVYSWEPLLTGSPCTTGADCPGLSCVDGVCCSTVCAGPCEACSAAKKGGGDDGVCGPITANTDPENDCPFGVCNGQRACMNETGLSCSTAAQCLSGLCIDGVCCDTPCDQSCMACSAAKKGGGVDGICGSVAYDTDPNHDCGIGIVCDGQNMCKRRNGMSCTAAAQCLSNYCVDGVCCNNICMGECMACSAQKKGDANHGSCGPIAADTDPDEECAGGECTAAGTCSTPQTKAANGAACVSAAQCASGFCADGVCCDSWCLGACMACIAAKKGSGSDGTCGAIAYDTDPDKECWGGSCNGQGVCKLYNGMPCSSAATCLSGYCVDGFCCGNVCDGLCSACSAIKKGQGVDGVCEPIANGVDLENECTPGACNGSGNCKELQTLRPNGAACSYSAHCASGFCADGVCCDSPCDDLCQSCRASIKGQGADGACGPIQHDTDPEDECFGGACSGQGSCRDYNGLACSGPAECLSNYCVDGVCCNNVCMDECSACTAAKKGAGLDGLCGLIAANTDPDQECAGGECTAAGTCSTAQPKAANGAACISAAQCASGYCADGVCCNSWCLGTCQACTAAKKGSGVDGTCGWIPFDSDPDEECWSGACNGNGVCKGHNGQTCSSGETCLSGYCADGYCCGHLCDGLCSACSAAKKGYGLTGVCEPIADGRDPDNECAQGTCDGSGLCNAAQPNGASCTTAAECASGHCINDRCCNTACSASGYHCASNGICSLTTTTTGTTGGMGGDAHLDQCPSGQVMIGFYAGFSAGYYNYIFADFVTLCGIPSLVSTGPNTWKVTIAPGAKVPTGAGRGNANNQLPEAAYCPPDQFIVGVEGQGSTHSIYTHSPVKMSLRCAPITATGPQTALKFTLGAVTIMPALGKVNGYSFGPLDCPAGYAASGSNLRSGDILDRYGLFCSAIDWFVPVP